LQRRGADEAINYVSENLRGRINELTGQRGVDMSSIGRRLLHRDRPARHGLGRTSAVIGFAAGDIPKIPINLALLKERRSSASIGANRSSTTRRPRTQCEATGGMVGRRKGEPVISERVPLSKAADAMKRMFNRQVKGKVVVLPES